MVSIVSNQSVYLPRNCESSYGVSILLPFVERKEWVRILLCQPKLNLTDSLPISQCHRDFLTTAIRDFLVPYDALRLEFVGVVPTREIARRIGLAPSTVRTAIRRFQTVGLRCANAVAEV